MPRLTEEIRKYVGMETERQLACDPVERGAVRRYQIRLTPYLRNMASADTIAQRSSTA